MRVAAWSTEMRVCMTFAVDSYAGEDLLAAGAVAMVELRDSYLPLLLTAPVWPVKIGIATFSKRV